MDMQLMNEVVRASLHSQLLSCFVTASQPHPGLLIRTQSLDIYQLIEIATTLVLQRKKLPGENLRDPIQQKVKIYKYYRKA
jgi:hypothetical protein